MDKHRINGEGTLRAKPLASFLSDDSRTLRQPNSPFDEDDEHLLRLAGKALAGQTETILTAWEAFTGSRPQWPGCADQPQHRAAVRKLLSQWLLDTHTHPPDQPWLAYQLARTRRRPVASMNQAADEHAEPLIRLHEMLAFIVPLKPSLYGVLAARGYPTDLVCRMYAVWLKALMVSALLRSHPFVYLTNQ
ncbi:protoglobin domain-containing protein [Spirosoma luteolum]